MNIPVRGMKFYAKGEQSTSYTPGDFILVDDTTLFSRLIALGQAFRFGKSVYNKWSHAALVATNSGDLIEANGRRVGLAKIDKYLHKDYLYVNVFATDADRIEALQFAESCLGQKYGWTTIVSISLSLLTGLKLAFGFDGQEICSGLVARALERTTAIFPRDPSHITPSELAKYYLESIPRGGEHT